MQVQQFLQFDTAEERRNGAALFCRNRGFTDRQIAVLCLICEHGEKRSINGQAVSIARMAKADAGKRLKCSPNTFLLDVRDLEALGVVGVLRNVRPWTYIVNWSRIDRLDTQPDDDLTDGLANHPVFDVDWSPSVNDGQSRSTTVNDGQSVRDSVNKIHTRSVYRGSVDPCSMNQAGSASEPRRGSQPWNRTSGVRDEDLVGAVSSGDLEVLRSLYREACQLGWIEDSEDARLRFLTICHHAATCSGVGNRMGVLAARVKRDLDVHRIRQASEQWASGVLRRSYAAAVG